MRAVDPLLAELEQESASTRRLLEAIPEEQYGFKPHEKAMTMGELAGHIAGVPPQISEILSRESFDISEMTGPPTAPEKKAQMLELFEQGVAAARGFLNDLDDQRATANWSLTKGDTKLMTIPRLVAIRSFLFNHIYHHRGQLTTYLRIIGAKVPSIYGPSADENPFE